MTVYDDPAHVLLVEDNPLDARVAMRTMQAWQTPHTVAHVVDGGEAMRYLAEASARPNLVLLDLNLPTGSGHDVLAEMRADDALRLIPVVVLTTSESEQDVRRSYELGANAFVTKPNDLDGWRDALADVESFWFGRATLPPSEA